MEPLTILLSAGDPSGDMYAARLASALVRRTGAHLFGMGGPHMREAGVELLADLADIAVVGITETLRKLPAVWRTWRRLEDEAARRRPQLAILVDSPGFHFHLARRLKARRIRAVCFIGPQVWAWRPGRVKWICERYERVLCIFPFEEAFYRERGVHADYIGHPLVDTVRAQQTHAEFAAAHRLDPTHSIVALLPGSRASEVHHNWPTMLEACRLIRQRQPVQFVLAAAPSLPQDALTTGEAGDLAIRVVSGATYDALAASDCAVVSSGTATVEAALLGVPMVVVYRVSALTALIARRMVRTPFFGMVNLIAGRQVVPELIQQKFTADAVAREVLRLLESSEACERVRRDLAEVRQKLGSGGAIERAADIIAAML